ncbi:MAG TPA: MFS transporter [Pyrinomonadaceae bacterium]|nr:MFS transporter [Pyrinomonadaceae bacterium]
MSAVATAVADGNSQSVQAFRPFRLLEVKPNPYVGTFGVFLGAGISTLFGRLLSVGLPDLRGALGLGFDEAAWLPTAYSMGLMFMGPFSVYLGGVLGVRRVLLFATPIFIVASILLPFSPNLTVMLTLQVIAGISSGTFYPLTMTYALRSLPFRYTIYGIGVYSMDILPATSLAVPLEAWFIEHMSWRWIFWIGALLATIMTLCIYRAIPHPPPRTGPRPAISWRGFLYFSLGLSLAYAALDQGERLNWLESGVIVALVVTGAFLVAAAMIRRWRSPNPLVNIPHLKLRNTLILGATLFSFRFVLLAIALLIPAFLGAIQGYRPLQTGNVLVWGVVPQIFAGIIAAWLMRRCDNRLILAIGFAIVAVACLMNTQLSSAWAGQNFFSSQLVIGAGLSVAFVAMVGSFVQQAANSGALSAPINVLTYSAFIHTVRILGGELGTAFMQRFITLREQFHSNLIGLHVEVGNWLTDERLRFLTGGVNANSAGVDEAQGRAAALLGGQIRQQAYTLAYTDGFMIIAWVCVGIIVLIACLKPMTILFDSQSPNPPA